MNDTRAPGAAQRDVLDRPETVNVLLPAAAAMSVVLPAG